MIFERRYYQVLIPTFRRVICRSGLKNSGPCLSLLQTSPTLTLNRGGENEKPVRKVLVVTKPYSQRPNGQLLPTGCNMPRHEQQVTLAYDAEELFAVRGSRQLQMALLRMALLREGISVGRRPAAPAEARSRPDHTPWM